MKLFKANKESRTTSLTHLSDFTHICGTLNVWMQAECFIVCDGENNRQWMRLEIRQTSSSVSYFSITIYINHLVVVGKLCTLFIWRVHKSPYCHAKHYLDIFGGYMGFEKTCVTFCCDKMLKQQNLTCPHSILSSLLN